MTSKTKLVLVGDSWCAGVWQIYDTNKIKLTHPGMSKILKDKGYHTVNFGVGGSSLWQILHRIHLYFNETSKLGVVTNKIVVFQTEADRNTLADSFFVNYEEILDQSENLHDFYLRTLDIFYIKLNNIAQQYNTTIYIAGGSTDLNLELLTKINSFSNLKILSESWIKLLYPEHQISMIPLTTDSEFLQMTLEKKHYKIADEIIELADKKIIPLQLAIETDYFDKEFGHFHPNLLGHNLMAEYIDNFFKKENHA